MGTADGAVSGLSEKGQGTVMRKIAIILAALGITALAYWGYLQWSGSGVLEPPASRSEHELTMPTSSDDAQSIDQTKILLAEKSYYEIRDEMTKEVKQVFGFMRLVNPGRQSVRWQVEKPYMIFYESAYQCRVDADNGVFLVERTANGITPKDAQLEGNVTIRLTPRTDSSMAETTLLFDDLLFSSERTEFSTDGPVRVTSSQIELLGRGLVLLFNAQGGQVEYLHILYLESLRLKGFVQSNQRLSAAKPDTEDLAPSSQEKSAAASKPAGRTDITKTAAKTLPLYQCVLEDNVMIRYGDQIVVAGGDQVSIQNILLNREKTTEPEQTDASGKTTPTTPAVAEATASKPIAETSMADDRRDVLVTCDGGIVFQLMPAVDTTAMAVQMNGTPLRIEQVDPQSPDKTFPIAHCGLLQYDMISDVLKLFTDNRQDNILLGGDQTGGRIETQGPVVWDRKTNQAQIAGPGKVYFDDSDASDSGEIAFAGKMDVIFAKPPAQESSLSLTAVNLTGGMSAQLRGNGIFNTAAETAHLAFGPDNALTSARLEGAVRFENADAQSPSNATAQTAVFYFDDQRQIARADLTGDVRFASDSGRLQTEAAMIAFSADTDGTTQPTQFTTSDRAILETLDAASQQPPTRFEAQNIRYDLQTGSGRASGPVRFVFYQASDPNSESIARYYPVEITADGDAEFIASADREIETVIFNRNVNGVRTQQYAAYTQIDAFHCDTMNVKIGRDTEGVTGLERITLRDGDVYAESKRTHETLKLAHTRLSCREIVYDLLAGRAAAVGPGEIAVDNSKAEPSASSGSEKSINLGGPSFAQIKGFDLIEWYTADGRIIADGKRHLLELAYIPVVNGVPDKVIRAASGHVEMVFADDAEGRTQLVKLEAKDKVFFEEPGKHIFEGQTLLYPAMSGSDWLSITGTEDRPCMVDGARVPYIHYNRTTGELETRLSTIPGAIPVP